MISKGFIAETVALEDSLDLYGHAIELRDHVNPHFENNHNAILR
jgi:hypothetical protein